MGSGGGWVSTNRLLPRRGNPLAPCASPLERKINRTFTYWPGTMTNASVHSDHMPRQELDRSIVKINEEAALQFQKTLIEVGMTVPMINLSHRAYPNFMIVNFSNWVVIVALPRCCFDRTINDSEGRILSSLLHGCLLSQGRIYSIIKS